MGSALLTDAAKSPAIPPSGLAGWVDANEVIHSAVRLNDRRAAYTRSGTVPGLRMVRFHFSYWRIGSTAGAGTAGGGAASGEGGGVEYPAGA